MMRALGVVAVAWWVSACIPDFTLPPQKNPGDRKPPQFSAFLAAPSAATTGTVVTLDFDADEELPAAAAGQPANPDVTFAGRAMACVPVSLHFTCSFTVTSDVPAGVQGFRIVGRDGAGNVSDPVVPAVQVVVDFTPPVLTVGASPMMPEVGATVIFAITSDEALGRVPDVIATVLDGPVQCGGAVPGTTFSCTGLLLVNAPLGVATYTVEGRDVAGNTGRAMGELTIAPSSGNSPSIVMRSVTPNPARRGADLTIDFTANQGLTLCRAQVGSAMASCPLPANATRCLCTYTIGASENEGPANVTLTIGNAAGQAQAVEPIDLDFTAPLVNAGAWAVLRRPMGIADGVFGDAGAAADSLGMGYATRRAVSVNLWGGADAGVVLLSIPVDDAGGFETRDLPGTEDAGFAQLWASAVDLAQNEGTRALLPGGDLAGPTGDGGLMTLVRRDVTAVDGVTGAAGAFRDSSAVASVELYDSASAGMLLAAGPADPAGGFAELPIGTPTMSYARVWVAALDKNGSRGARTEALVGRALAGPTAAGANMTVVRRDLTAADGVTGAAGALTGPCYPALAEVFSAASGGSPLGSAPTTVAGGFSEVPVGTATSSFASLFVSGRDKCGLTGARASVINGQATAGPTGSAAAMVINRRDSTVQDGVVGMAGAFNDPVSALVSVNLYNSSSGGTPIASGALAANGAFTEILVGSPTSAPARVWGAGVDKAGLIGARVEVTTGADTTPPVVNVGQLSFVRRDFTQADGVVGASGAVSDPVNAAVTARFYNAASGGGQIATGSIDTAGAIAELAIGSPDASYARLWLAATDKCNNTAARVEVLAGSGDAGPVLSGAAMTITRRPTTQADGVSGAAGAIVDACFSRVSVYSVSSGGTPLGEVVSQATGAFPEVTFGTPSASFPWAYASVADKCGRSSARVQVSNGIDTVGPVADPAQIILRRRDLTQPDSAEGLSGAVVDPVNAAVSVRITSNVTPFPVLATVPVVNGGFADTPIGTATSSFRNLRFDATDKCGNTGATVVGLAANGAETVFPVIDGGSMTYFDRANAAPDGVVGIAGTVTPSTTPIARAQLFDRPGLGGAAVSAPFLPAANGGFPEQDAGVGSRWRVYLEVEDKAGFVQRMKVTNTVATATLAGRLPYDESASRLAMFPFAADRDPHGNLVAPGFGLTLGSEASAAQNTAASAIDAQRATVTASGVPAASARAWAPVTTANQPSARARFGMAYDIGRARTVLFGGQDVTGVVGDTWEYDGTNWTQKTPAASPPGHQAHAMGYDAQRGRVVIAGGLFADGGIARDSWEYDGLTWQQDPQGVGNELVDEPMACRTHLSGACVSYCLQNVSPGLTVRREPDLGRLPFGFYWIATNSPNSPDGGWGWGAAYDSIRDRPVFFGSHNGVSVRSDTYELSNNGFVRATPAQSPDAGHGRAMAFDPVRGVSVLFGGAGTPACCAAGTLFGDTWEYDGTTWAQATTASAPPARSQHALVYDVARKRTVTFGGNVSGTLAQDTWEYSAAVAHGQYAAQLFLFKLPHDWFPSQTAPVSALTVTYVGAGRGDNASVPTWGVTVSAGRVQSAYWTTLGSHSAQDVDPAAARTLVMNVPTPGNYDSSDRIFVLVQATYPSSVSGAIPSELFTDYVELQLTYSDP